MQEQPSSTWSSWSEWAHRSHRSEWAHWSDWSPWSTRSDRALPSDDDSLLCDELGASPRAAEPADAEPATRGRTLLPALQGALTAAVVLAGLSAFAGGGELFAGLTRIRAERQLASGDFAGASALLESALAKSPDSTRLLLLKIRADLLAGNANAAFGLIERLGDRPGSPELVAEIQPVLERVSLAVEKARQAERVAVHDLAHAAGLWQEAAALYPESPTLGVSAGLAHGAAALERRDLAELMRIASELAARHPEHPFVVAQLASAQAALYAAVGDPPLRAQAEASLAHAQQLARAFDADPREIARQAERIRQRLASREIPTRREYERRFATGRSRTSQH